MKQPSIRIGEILKEKYSGDVNFLSVAIERYLDEQWEAGQKKDKEVERKIRLGMLL